MCVCVCDSCVLCLFYSVSPEVVVVVVVVADAPAVPIAVCGLSRKRYRLLVAATAIMFSEGCHAVCRIFFVKSKLSTLISPRRLRSGE